MYLHIQKQLRTERIRDREIENLGVMKERQRYIQIEMKKERAKERAEEREIKRERERKRGREKERGLCIMIEKKLVKNVKKN